MSAGPGVAETIMIALATALVTTVGTGWLVMPRLEARKRRIMDAHQARDRFLATMLRILSASGRLQKFEAPNPDDAAWTPVMRERVEAERARWVKQLDEATEWMVDNVETYAVSWPTDFLRGLIGTYVPYARAVMISEREDDRKAELLEWLTTPVWEVFGSRGWQRSPRRLARAQRQLGARIAEIEAEADRQNAAAVAA
ncbi:hypothetical protein [Streptomyces sp. NBC_00887]|uniref:hypothetical protein n=1 Tax=Streptomyces sp. NBC_00887 TaxID=2975859 RepID=UPI0038692576|nr:hypothetical protein OG844_04685 [Streptomyces sp. NBC_00887]WSY35620.1 hypothetical protein OG844_40915 [Streptomyces sp. NBC_00887]